MAIRRSARIRRAQESPEVEDPTPQQTQQTPVSRLASVAEREETVDRDLPHVQTPVAKTPSQKTPNASTRIRSVTARTPTSVTAARPPREEMHPSKVHQSTTKRADSGLILGFNPIKKDADGRIIKQDVIDNTPTKSKASPATSQFGTPGFEFKFSSQENDLSDQAKKLMESVRGDVARIKAQMVHDKSKQDAEDHGDRKIAMPKGRAGRFSDVHMAEFKKMDSIAGHASAFRATPGRFQPVTKSLKRSKSKAQLDEPESQSSSPSRPAAKASALPTPVPAAAAKRVKHNKIEDTSSRRGSEKPAEKPADKPMEKPETPRRPAGPRPRPGARNSLMTPTRASLARTTATSIKAPRTSMIPSLKLSPVAKTIASPRTPRTDFNPRLKGNLPTLSNLRSILRRRQPLFSRDPAQIASGTHVAVPDFKTNSLFAAPPADLTDSAPTPSPKKHVEFTPTVKSRHELAQDSPSPSKVPSVKQRSTSTDVFYPVLPTLTPEKNSAISAAVNDSPSVSSIRRVRPSNGVEQTASVPEIPVVAHGIAHGIGNKKRHRSEVDDTSNTENTENVPPADAHTEERSTKRLKSCPPTPSPVKPSPMKRLTRTPVRPSTSKVGTPASTRQKNRGVLSMSRLNMLSKPKGQA
ncbi:hypothetical protein PENANT_c014G07941 [Penicillium antarcticum]|uniref:Erythromycin esterase n=1 Tax=Penicillium antarcticum TaxID=416450 RepID=A0A1V6Q434_9EURO|nr:uncharacterized protein N7508_009527 [Penicillium antarcticum]KAJ5294706.1 hypothetical protein N7508_009527 [Penicillium antarcticum]OQD84023.1 hypothetical protein PENANT_c014G07941 [Penicillium antarcticum]